MIGYLNFIDHLSIIINGNSLNWTYYNTYTLYIKTIIQLYNKITCNFVIK
jgi:hypothetical protein